MVHERFIYNICSSLFLHIYLDCKLSTSRLLAHSCARARAFSRSSSANSVHPSIYRIYLSIYLSIYLLFNVCARARVYVPYVAIVEWNIFIQRVGRSIYLIAVRAQYYAIPVLVARSIAPSHSFFLPSSSVLASARLLLARAVCKCNPRNYYCFNVLLKNHQTVAR